MQGNIQIEVLNENAIIVATRLKGVSDPDKRNLVMAIAQAIGLTLDDARIIYLMYPDFLAKSKHTILDLSNNRSIPDL